MTITERTYTFNGALTKRSCTDLIILHHRAGTGDVDSIHHAHKNANGWAGIGYHFYVRKNGEVFRGRPINTVGAHTENENYHSIGICFEGNYETDKTMPAAQKIAGQELVSYLLGLYPKIKVMKHKDFAATSCPGKYFPFDKISKGVNELTLNEAIEVLKKKVGLEQQTIDFLLCYIYGKELIVKMAKSVN